MSSWSLPIVQLRVRPCRVSGQGFARLRARDGHLLGGVSPLEVKVVLGPYFPVAGRFIVMSRRLSLEVSVVLGGQSGSTTSTPDSRRPTGDVSTDGP